MRFEPRFLALGTALALAVPILSGAAPEGPASPAWPNVVFVLLSRAHTPSALFPLAAIDTPPPGYVCRRTAADPKILLDGAEAAWAGAERITWGPDAIATSFRALWSAAGLLVRYDVTDTSPWHTLTKRDERLWNEEVVELFLDVGATGRSYAEVEWNPVNAVVDLWVDRAENRFDKDWDWAGLESRVHARRDGTGRATGWTAVSFLPWSALAAKAPSGASVPPKAGDRWRFNAFRIERPGGPAEPERDVQLLAWAPTGERSFHVPRAFREIVFADSPQAAGRRSTGRLNTVSIVTDDQAARAVGAYGDTLARMRMIRTGRHKLVRHLGASFPSLE